MTAEQKISQKKLTLLQIAAKIKNVAEAGRLWHYNHTRLHMALDGKTPIQSLLTFPQSTHIKQLRCYPC